MFMFNHYQKISLMLFIACAHNCMADQTLYEILGIPQNATKTEIKQAYKKLTLTYHPDAIDKNLSPLLKKGEITQEKFDKRKKESEEHFKNIKNAYEILNDPQLKTDYDKIVKYVPLQNALQEYEKARTDDNWKEVEKQWWTLLEKEPLYMTFISFADFEKTYDNIKFKAMIKPIAQKEPGFFEKHRDYLEYLKGGTKFIDLVASYIQLYPDQDTSQPDPKDIKMQDDAFAKFMQHMDEQNYNNFMIISYYLERKYLRMLSKNLLKALSKPKKKRDESIWDKQGIVNAFWKYRDKLTLIENPQKTVSLDVVNQQEVYLKDITSNIDTLEKNKISREKVLHLYFLVAENYMKLDKFRDAQKITQEALKLIEKWISKDLFDIDESVVDKLRLQYESLSKLSEDKAKKIYEEFMQKPSTTAYGTWAQMYKSFSQPDYRLIEMNFEIINELLAKNLIKDEYKKSFREKIITQGLQLIPYHELLGKYSTIENIWEKIEEQKKLLGTQYKYTKEVQEKLQAFEKNMPNIRAQARAQATPPSRDQQLSIALHNLENELLNLTKELNRA